MTDTEKSMVIGGTTAIVAALASAGGVTADTVVETIDKVAKALISATSDLTTETPPST